MSEKPPSENPPRRQPTSRRLRHDATVITPLVLLVLLAIPALSATAQRPAKRELDQAAPASTPAQTPAGSGSRGPRVLVSVDPAARLTGLPRSFLGLSTEYWDFPVLDSDPAVFRRVFALLHAPGDGPMVLRIGGNSADHSYWRTPLRNPAFPAFEISPRWFARLRSLTEAAHLKLLLDLNLAAASPAMAASFVREAMGVLPRRSIEALEVGNEPDVYHREMAYRFAAAIAEVRPSPRRTWGHYSAGRYADEFKVYAQAVGHAGRMVPLAGPEVANPRLDLRWLSRLVAVDRNGVGLLTAHRYPLSACLGRNSPDYPTIDRVLSNRTSAGLARSVLPAVRLARRAGLPFRVTEMNSATCGGVLGVSDTFATALWAPDALFSLVRAGVDGVNVHVRAGAANAAFDMTPAGLVAHPLLYGLIAFTRTLGTGAELVRTHVQAPARTNVKAWAVATRGGMLHVLALDKGSRSVRLALRVPTDATASVQRLLAPDVRAENGVTLAGQTLGLHGQWLGRRVIQKLTPGPDATYALGLPAHSAALISVKLARSAPGVAITGPHPGQPTL